jgi:hypothetical protein
VSDSEVAARLADALGLAARIEPSSAVHRRLSREGDPLPFLFRRARACGRIAAITSGCLHFASTIASGRFRELAPGPRIRSLSISAGASGRRGSLVVLGLLDLAPLDRLLLWGFGGGGDGLFRVARARIGFVSGNATTEVTCIEKDEDLAFLREEGLGPARASLAEAVS